LILQGGEILSQGPIAKVITSPTMTRAFGSRIAVRRQAGRFELRFARPAGTKAAL
jgi:hypothetical protein